MPVEVEPVLLSLYEPRLGTNISSSPARGCRATATSNSILPRHTDTTQVFLDDTPQELEPRRLRNTEVNQVFQYLLSKVCVIQYISELVERFALLSSA